MEGTTTGSFNETTFFNGLVFNAEQQLALIEKFGGLEGLGGEHSAPHFAAAWAHAQNTPFQWGKQMASHLGGDRDPMVIAWPGHIPAGGAVRDQFTHCIDVAPTVLELIGIPEPKVVDGIEQEPMDGTPFAYTFEDPEAEDRHTVQYFEMYGSRAIYKDGWWACARLDKLPWDFSPPTLARFKPGSGWDPDKDDWELYYLPDDFSQARNIAADNPDKLAELKELFYAEAARNKALPILGGMAAFFGILPPMPTTTRFAFHGDVQNVSTTVIPRIYGRSYSIEADIHVPEGGAEGVLCAFADFIGGFSLWVDERGHLVHTYQFLGVDTYKQVSDTPIPTGDVLVKMLFEMDEPKPGAGGKVTLLANEDVIGEGRLEHTCSMLFTTYAGMDMGRDNGGVVDEDYADKAPYPFTGTLRKVVFDLHPMSLEDELALHESQQHAAVGAGAAG
jgi:arylsulfatase